MNDLFSHVRSYHEYQSNIYWLPFKGELKTKLFHRLFEKIPEAGPAWVVIIESFDSLATPLREGEVEEREFYATDRSQNF